MQDNNINGSDAVRVLCIAAGQRYQWYRCNACSVYFGRTAISIVAMQCVFFWQDSDINGSVAMSVYLWQDNDINCSDAMRVLCISAGQRYYWQRCNA